jgi:uncharacterized protein YjdB
LGSDGTLYADQNGDGAITVAELGKMMGDTLAEYSKKYPDQAQTPGYITQYGNTVIYSDSSYKPSNQDVSIQLSKKKITTKKGEKTTLTATVKNTFQKVKWSSSNQAVASVNNKGVVLAKKAGKTVITAKISDTASAKCTVIVKNIKKPSITLNKSSATLYTSGSTSVILKATVKGESNKVIWSSSDQSIATVKNGKVTAKRAGKVTITAKANGKTAKCKIIVNNSHEKASIELTKIVRFTKIADVAKKLNYKKVKNNYEQYVYYSADGKKTSSQSYITCTKESKNKKGTWTIFILDKTLSVYGIKIGMNQYSADKILKNKGWQTTALSQYVWNSYTKADSYVDITLSWENGKVHSIYYSYLFWKM